MNSLLIAWLLLAGPAWSVVGGAVLPRRYRRRGLDAGVARLCGSLMGAALGPGGIAYLYTMTPTLRGGRHAGLPGAVVATELVGLFALHYPTNPCVSSASYNLNLLQNGLTLGMVYGTMAVGLTLIFSVQRVVSFAHGQLFMFGGVLAFLISTRLWDLNPLFAIPLAGGAVLLVGAAVDKLLLSPAYTGRVERPLEYALLATFGFGLFLQYALVGVLGNPSGIRSPRFTDRPLLGVDVAAFDFGPLRIRTDLLIAGVIGTMLMILLFWFLQRTWTGASLRAVSMDRQAASVVGIHAQRTFTAAFALGSMLAGMAGAALVPALNFPVPQIATQAAVRSYIIVVLGGLGSVPGAWLGGVIVGLIEGVGAGCFPDPGRAASYQLAFPLAIFALVLLIRPQGFFGRRE